MWHRSVLLAIVEWHIILQNPRAMKSTVFLNNDYYLLLYLYRAANITFDNRAERYLSFAMSNQSDDYVMTNSFPGIRVAVVPRGAKANMDFSTATNVPVSPGTDTNIQVSTTIRQRLSDPYTDCTDQQYLDGQHTIRYSTDACISLCLQQQVILRCK